MTINLAQFAQAYADGDRAARQIKPGDLFLGAFMEAEAHSYKRGTPYFRAFCIGYTGALGAVTTDSAGIVQGIA